MQQLDYDLPLIVEKDGTWSIGLLDDETDDSEATFFASKEEIKAALLRAHLIDQEEHARLGRIQQSHRSRLRQLLVLQKAKEDAGTPIDAKMQEELLEAMDAEKNARKTREDFERALLSSQDTSD